MSLLFAAILLAASDAVLLTHHEQFDHAGARVEVTYRGQMRAELRQVGSVSAPGRPQTLRCRWQARVTVDRHARHRGGVVTRRIEAPAGLSGTRPGWCAGQTKAIQAEMAAATGERMRAHLVEVAARDRAALIAELGQMQG
ncbi:hypothetical protein SAMN05216382_1803 [Sphingomonas palmae]|uniref:Uncharacterized protein n=1 Tax=Sphingomonas palmae TaxID=1855283 RepID=A0A1H7PBC9_9SPHN|nr:hypothetical protein [Sphingomonas palmae]SEL32724.1 hypothetical protein SAMN05216382_1803 [Sphingomonas palmae]